MPMMLLAIRVEIEIILKSNFRSFYAVHNGSSKQPIHQVMAMRLVNGVITEIFDPNIFFSRLSFLESGKDALDIKTIQRQGKPVNGYKLPKIQNKFYTRSALVSNLIPLPSEGKVRAKFAQNQKIDYPKPR